MNTTSERTMRTTQDAYKASGELDKYLKKYGWVSGVGVCIANDNQPGLRINVDANVDKKNLSQLPPVFGEFPVKVVLLHGAQLQSNPIEQWYQKLEEAFLTIQRKLKEAFLSITRKLRQLSF